MFIPARLLPWGYYRTLNAVRNLLKNPSATEYNCGGRTVFGGGVLRPHCPCDHTAVGTASTTSPVHLWMASAWSASLAGMGPCARNAACLASMAKAASSPAHTAGKGTSVMQRPVPAHAVSLAGQDPGNPAGRGRMWALVLVMGVLVTSLSLSHQL